MKLTAANVAAFILARAEAEFPKAIKCSTRKALEAKISGEREDMYLYIDFEEELETSTGKKFRTDACLNVDFSRDSKIYTNERGDKLIDHKLEAKISWPSWGTDNLEMCAARLGLMNKLLKLAQDIQEEFDEIITETVATKEEIEDGIAKRRAAEHKAAMQNTFNGLVIPLKKNMRVCAERFVDVPHGLDFGSYSYTDENGKVFSAEVTSDRGFYFMRTK